MKTQLTKTEAKDDETDPESTGPSGASAYPSRADHPGDSMVFSTYIKHGDRIPALLFFRFSFLPFPSNTSWVVIATRLPFSREYSNLENSYT